METFQPELLELRVKMLDVMENVLLVLVGKREQVFLALATILANRNLLAVDVPGTGKTVFAKAFARSLDVAYNRIQFRADTRPAEISGSYEPDPEADRKLAWELGPIFSNFILADEINRAPPKTQSALLEPMDERQVTLKGVTRALPEPFWVFATQNPLESEGTYPLPPPELDRFFLQISLGYAGNLSEEEEILFRQDVGHPIDDLRPVTSAQDLLQTMEHVFGVRNVRPPEVHLAPEIRTYIARLVRALRDREEVEWSSTRGGLVLQRAGRAVAFLEGRPFVLPRDIQRVAVPALAHRMTLTPGSSRKTTPELLVRETLEAVEEPPGSFRA